MTSRRIADQRVTRWLEAEAPDTVPDRVLAATFERTRGLAQDRPPLVRLPWGNSRGRTLLVVAAVLATSIGVVLIPGASRPSVVTSPADALDSVRDLNRIRIAIRPDHPQFAASGRIPAGFDADVAGEIGVRLHVQADVSFLDASTMLTGSIATWDAALPSVPAWRVDRRSFLVTTAYYYWPHRVVVPARSTATSLADVAAGPICAVSGDAGLDWLRGTDADRLSTPRARSILTAGTDADCLSLLSSGEAVAAVTADLNDADLQVRAELRVIGGGPVPEPRAVIVHAVSADGRSTAALLDAINAALAAMRADGTLTRLSQNRFGGADLTSS